MHTIIHAIISYFFLLLTVRILSRRPGAQMTPVEFVLVFLVGGVAILIVRLIPQRPTIWRAMAVSCWMSDSAPVVGSP